MDETADVPAVVDYVFRITEEALDSFHMIGAEFFQKRRLRMLVFEQFGDALAIFSAGDFCQSLRFCILVRHGVWIYSASLVALR